MEILATLVVLLVAVMPFEVAALTRGTDSRPSIGDDHRR
jgi:hypothetical protein